MKIITKRSRAPSETFKALPIYAENSWRVLGSWGTVEGVRMSQENAERLAKHLNNLPPTGYDSGGALR